MIQAHLTTDHLWRGVSYPAGDRQIPEDLAIALGLPTEPDPQNSAPIEPTQADAVQQTSETSQAQVNGTVHESASSTGTVQGTKRRTKR